MTDKKPKILLLSDDLRWHSGIATMSRSFVRNTLDRFDWVQLGAAIKHPEEGKVADMSQFAQKEWGIPDASLKVYSISGYGTPDILRQVMNLENPDAILHFTDPRFWIWLYQIEHEIRSQVPIMFYHIWDDLPYPMYNRNYYESCDWIGCISKQTYNIVKNVWGSERKSSWKQPDDWQVAYVPHGVDDNQYFPVRENHEQWADLQKMRTDICNSVGASSDDIDFILMWANRNIRRKMPGDVILAYKLFCDRLPKEKADRCLLVMHTAPIDDNGTDLIAVKNELCPDYKVAFSAGSLESLNHLMNIGDVTINIASNEGFGLTTAESLMAGTPIIVNVTGGLQDQCGFRDENGDLVTVEHFTKEWGTNHDGRYTDHGSWVKPVFPSTINLVGSPPTPYIFDDRVKIEDVVDAIEYWYNKTPQERRRAGQEGREFVLGKGNLNAKYMADAIADGVNTTLENWKPRERYQLIEV